MKILITVGHSILKNGGTTSAVGHIHEYNYNKVLAPYVKEEIEKCGHSVDVVVCPERKFTSWTQERGYKLPIANSGKYDLVCELHLNASNGQGNGSEVLCYGDSKGKSIAKRGADALAKLGFKNRGVKVRRDLYIIAQTNPVAVLFESFFCDNKHDCDLANKLGYREIAKAICYGLVGDVRGSSPRTKEQPQVNKPKLVMYLKDGNKLTAEFIAQQLRCDCVKDDGKSDQAKDLTRYEIVYVGDLGKDRQETAKIALEKYLGIK